MASKEKRKNSEDDSNESQDELKKQNNENEDSQSSSTSNNNSNSNINSTKKLKKFDEHDDKAPKVSKIQLKLMPSVPASKIKPTATEKEKKSADEPAKKEKAVSEKVAKAFAEDSDEDNVEEMPFEAKMKMRNIGRNTPTASGPNSYGKTKLGFTDQRKLFEKELLKKAEELAGE